MATLFEGFSGNVRSVCIGGGGGGVCTVPEVLGTEEGISDCAVTVSSGRSVLPVLYMTTPCSENMGAPVECRPKYVGSTP